MQEKKPLIVIAGPTASGKTALSIDLAGRIGGEIISADSMQVYRHMDIGSAKVTPEEMQGIPHHLIDVLDPTEEFNVVVFQKLAGEAIREIESRGHIPVIVGGTGFYIQALVYDIDFTETEEDSALREELAEIARLKGPGELHRLLEEADPASARAIHENNVKRMIRALEFYRQTGKRISEHNEQERGKESPWNLFYYVLTMERSLLYDRINRRVDRMMEQGLPEEVERLRQMGCRADMTSMQGLGYKELLAYLEHGGSLAETAERIKQNTRHFAKRQLTWFRRERDVRWLYADQMSEEEMLARITEDLRTGKPER
ncbi:MAG: tRNA (adenosine(37)-N6)-dimethylallyltransferase MiaA [Clostridium sp.]|nr:tRNA (adenosine(37)-N6)-dimethylallyltransferase MiaA [Clostridium sp.]